MIVINSPANSGGAKDSKEEMQLLQTKMSAQKGNTFINITNTWERKAQPYYSYSIIPSICL